MTGRDRKREKKISRGTRKTFFILNCIFLLLQWSEIMTVELKPLTGPMSIIPSDT
jgi:hypothetical protein